ncbi:MAG: carboxypeptidase regulatory-like domain-containing protein, partial [Vicinamibacterales bacterium]
MVCISLLLPAAPLWAQAAASGISGTVRDESGAVLPGVTVEAASPALIEKVRAVVTDAQGNYNIIDLRPGQYSVTFTLPGFSVVKREGIALVSGFTANVSADMKVGSLEETITVTGAAPLVDVQNVRQQTVVERTEIEALPVGQGSTSSLVSLVPGLGDGGLVDVGGTGGAWQAGRATYGTYHGKIGLRTTMDGMRTQNTGTGKAPGYTINMNFVEEVAVETGGITAEGSASAMAMNHIPKEGSNQFRFTLAGRFMSSGMQANNLNDELRTRGATTPQQVEKLHDEGLYVGGPILRDRIWFYSGVRRWGFGRQIPGLFENATIGGLTYTPDLARPVTFKELDQSAGGRLTVQVSAKNKVNFFGDYQNMSTSHGNTGSPASAPETQNQFTLKPSGIVQASWTNTVSNKLLLEAGAGAMLWHQLSELQPGVSPDAITILETATNFRYNAPTTFYTGDDPWKVDRY